MTVVLISDGLMLGFLFFFLPFGVFSWWRGVEPVCESLWASVPLLGAWTGWEGAVRRAELGLEFRGH